MVKKCWLGMFWLCCLDGVVLARLLYVGGMCFDNWHKLLEKYINVMRCCLHHFTRFCKCLALCTTAAKHCKSVQVVAVNVASFTNLAQH